MWSKVPASAAYRPATGSLLRPARVLDLDAFPLGHRPEAEVARCRHAVGGRRVDDGALVPRLARHRVVCLQLELRGPFVVPARLFDADPIGARDARHLVLTP